MPSTVYPGRDTTIADLRFTGDADTGLNYTAANTFALMAGGTNTLSVTATALTVASTARIVNSNAGSLAATGTNQGTAAAITNTWTNVTASDGTKGVILPAATAGAEYTVYNSVATNGLPIYPATGETINGGSANAAITIEGKTVAILRCIVAGNWAAAFTVNT